MDAVGQRLAALERQLSAVTGRLSRSLSSAGRRLSDLSSQVDQIGLLTVRAAAVDLPVLAVGSTEVPVSWSPAMSGSNYLVVMSISGPASVAGKLLTMVKANSVGAAGCIAIVSNISSGAIASGNGKLICLAVRPQASVFNGELAGAGK